MSLNRLLTPSKRWLIAKLLTYSIPFFFPTKYWPPWRLFHPRIPRLINKFAPSKGEPADIYFNLNSNSQDFYVSPMTKELFSFLHCASSYVSSKNFGQSRQSYIGCTCSSVCFQMSPQIACLRKGKVTLVAFVRRFSTVRFQMFPQIACMRRGIVILSGSPTDLLFFKSRWDPV